MSDKNRIEWTDATWNPVRGCSKASPGCKHCYAETFSERFRGVKDHPFEQGFDLRLVPEKLEEPLRWKKPRRVFVNSMSDLFHEAVPDGYILRVAEVMMRANRHTYQVLTKRSERMRDLLNSKLGFAALAGHIWWGVSAEDRKHGVPRIGHLQAANAAVRFLSVEPLLEDIGELDRRRRERNERAYVRHRLGALRAAAVPRAECAVFHQAAGSPASNRNRAPQAQKCQRGRLDGMAGRFACA